MFPTDRAAGGALALYAKSSMVGCLENLFEKQIRQDPDPQDRSTTSSSTSTARTSPVSATTASSTRAASCSPAPTARRSEIGVGSAAVRVGRAVDVVTYTTDGRFAHRRADARPSTRRCPVSAPHSLGVRRDPPRGRRGARAVVACARRDGAVPAHGCVTGLVDGRRRPREGRGAGGVRLPGRLDAEHARPDLRPGARRRGGEDRRVQAVPRVQQGEPEEPAGEVAQLRPRAVERHQLGERVPVGRQGRRPRCTRSRIRACPTASTSSSASVFTQQLQETSSVAKQLASVDTSIALGAPTCASATRRSRTRARSTSR